MLFPATEQDAPTTTRDSTHSVLVALGWSLAGAICAGGLWACGSLIGSLLLGMSLADFQHDTMLVTVVSALLAGGGAVTGLLGGLFVHIPSTLLRRGNTAVVIFIGMVVGLVGGGLTIPTVLLCERWVHPIVSSSLVWAMLGACAGLGGVAVSRQDDSAPHKARFSSLRLLLWSLAGSVCAGGLWATASLAGLLLFGTDSIPVTAIHGEASTTWALIYAAVDGGFGLLIGAGVGVIRRRENRVTSSGVLGFHSAIFGALGGGLSVFVVAATHAQVSPLLSSSLVWAGIGFLMGFCGYLWSRWIAEPPPSDDDDEITQPEGKKIEWLLRERKRRWREMPLVRVVPVLLVSLASLLGAAIRAPSNLALSLLAVGGLGLAVAFVLFNQEKRLRSLEQRFRQKRES